MNSVLWGLLGALLIGASDTVARVTSQRVSSTVVITFIMAVSTVMLSAWLLATADFPPWHRDAWLASALSGSLNIVALGFLYKALSRGPVSVASPSASTFSVLLVLMNMLGGEAWVPAQIVAVLLVFLAIVMLAQPSAVDADQQHYDAVWLRTTALYGVAAALAVSFRMFLAQEAGGEIGAVHALFLNRVFALVTSAAFLCWLLLRHVQLDWPRGSMWTLVLWQAVLETTALGAFLIGSAGSGRVGASVGFSAFAAATVVFARIWLKERVGGRRAIWIAVAMVGLMLAAWVSP